jgi:uncharacterized protein (TIGR02145 family)
MTYRNSYYMKNLLFFLVAILWVSIQVTAQVGININDSLPDPSAMLDVQSINKGFLPPRMTSLQRESIANPKEGLMVFCTNCGTGGSGVLSVFSNGQWGLYFFNCVSPAKPTAGIHIPSRTQIVWKWNTVSGATGYKWNTINDYVSATEMGTNTSKTETNLTCSTPYTRFVWAYNVCGISSVTTLTQRTSLCQFANCGTDSLTDSRDGKIYPTVLIGTQCWFKKNINVGTRISVTGNQTNFGIIEKYCYNDADSNCDVYGGLYQWAEVVQYLNGATNTSSWNPVPTGNVQGVCPEGWHIPTDAEWLTLTTFLGGTNSAGGKMKETGLTHWATPNTGATNESGFTALPGGYRDANGTSNSIFHYDYNWSGTEVTPSSAWVRYLGFDNSTATRDSSDKSLGFSVRCIND